MTLDNLEQHKHTLDVASIATMLGALMGWLPSVAAGVTIIWTGIRIYETKTVQKLLKKRNKK